MSALKGAYSSALNFIMRRELFGVKLGLENITKFLDKIGRPQDRFRSIHIAGTNGKGSTAAYIESILGRAGYRTGIFTSPHLVDYRERIKINGRQISREYITAFVNRHKYFISRNRVTFFEVCTALAYCYFADKKVDVAVIETGLGGRLDATNTLTPILSIITDISLDHTNILGNSLKRIAYEKAGIVKEGVPVLAGIMKPEPRIEIARVCGEREAPFSYLRKCHFSHNSYPFKFDYHHDSLKLSRLQSSLPGNHQIANAALSVLTVELLRGKGFQIDKKSIRDGLRKTYWPGRFQTIKSSKKPTIILDVGHNPAGIKAMVSCFKEIYPGKKADVIIGFVRNKDLKKSIGYIESIMNRAEIVRLNSSRTAEPQEVVSFFGKRALLSISNSVTYSAQRLINSAGPDDIVIICGSHFAVGEFMANQKNIL